MKQITDKTKLKQGDIDIYILLLYICIASAGCATRVISHDGPIKKVKHRGKVYTTDSPRTIKRDI
jgi:hypothetical protein